MALIADPAQLSALAARLATAAVVALDVEGNGLHAYRARLCTVQLGWRHEGAACVAIVDAIALAAAATSALSPLGAILGAEGPVKVLHDLTFDARLLAAAALPLERVRDTSVTARFLGEPETGLAALVRKHCDAELDKDLQDHDWAERPLSEQQLAYLAGDVRHLLELDERLSEAAVLAGIDAEIALECAYKLECARAPVVERPAHLRLKGYAELGPVARAIARHLCETRERIALELDLPPFRVAPAQLLCEMARRRPRSAEALRRLCRRHDAARWAEQWLTAVRLGTREGELAPPEPPEEPELSEIERQERAAERRLERAIVRWRRERALERGVDVQVVLPGHCLRPVVEALRLDGDEARREALARVAGLGKVRLDRYGDELLGL